MQAKYQLRIFSPTTGEQVASITDWVALNYVKHVNNYHNLTLILNAADPNISHFLLDAIVEVWRKPPSAAWYRELVTLYRTGQYNLYENGHETFTAYTRGLNDFLHRRHILYPAGTAFTLKEGPADDVMKAFVRENCTAAGDTALRKSFAVQSCVIPGLVVPDDTSAAPEWAGARAWLNLHDVLTEISTEPSNTDFEIVRVGNTGLDFEFRTYFPQRGVDRSSTLTFAPHLNNMRNVTFTHSRTEEATAVYVLGAGEGTSRTVLSKVADELVRRESLWNYIEVTTDARSQDSVLAVISQGEELLAKVKAQFQFKFVVMQTNERQYGVHYNVGDIVSSSYRQYTLAKKIIFATVSDKDGREDIALDFASEHGTSDNI